jgi:hypothetical protein
MCPVQTVTHVSGRSFALIRLPLLTSGPSICGQTGQVLRPFSPKFDAADVKLPGRYKGTRRRPEPYSFTLRATHAYGTADEPFNL